MDKEERIKQKKRKKKRKKETRRSREEEDESYTTWLHVRQYMSTLRSCRPQLCDKRIDAGTAEDPSTGTS